MTLDPVKADPTRSLRTTFKGLGTLVAPTSAITALLYYFGWTRTSVEANQLGLDDSLLGYSTQDYLLRSLTSMFAPLVVGLLAGLSGLGLHALVISWARRIASADPPPADVSRARRLIGRMVAGTAALGAVLLLLGFAGSQVSQPSRSMYVASPVCVTVGIVLVVYATNLYRRFLAAHHPGGGLDSLEGYNVLVGSSVVMLLLLSLFWNVSHYAVVKGRTLAATSEAMLPNQPDVIIYSRKRLYLQAPVVETRLDPANAAYNYAYSKLKLLFRSDGKYFLRPSDPTPVQTNIVIPDGLDIRLELYKS